MEFDEQKAVSMMNAALMANGRKPYDEDQILNVVDMIWDFYEENGLLDIDADNDEPEDFEQELVDYVCRMLVKDKNATVAAADVPILVQAEIDYEDSCLDA